MKTQRSRLSEIGSSKGVATTFRKPASLDALLARYEGLPARTARATDFKMDISCPIDARSSRNFEHALTPPLSILPSLLKFNHFEASSR